MTSLPEQLSAAMSKQLSAQFASHVDTQLRFFSTFTSQAFDNASRIVSLNLSASRASVERSSRTVRQLIGATQPRDLAVLRTHAEEQMRGLVDYSRELFNIAASAQPANLRTIVPTAYAPPALAAPVVQEAVARTTSAIEAGADAVQKATQDVVEQVTRQTVPEAVQKSAAQAAHAVSETIDAVADAATVVEKTVAQPAAAEPVVLPHEEAPVLTPSEAKAELIGEAAPVTEPKEIARAVGKGASRAAVAPRPMAAPVEDKDSASAPAIPPVPNVTAPADSKPPKRRK